ncbi:MAG: sulfurtransferase TusA family protein [Deltaproteobacteria bacterium]|jgi:TusA-related sulfurtransferase|nr:sulfurtransferase TusA family protein [Deltaproteobacteria bacterium]
MNNEELLNVNSSIDVTSVVCPMTFVKAKMALDDLEEGEILAIRLNAGEPILNVPRSLKDEGHKVLKLLDNQDGTYSLLVKKGS